jgi:hypothetical protein
MRAIKGNKASAARVCGHRAPSQFPVLPMPRPTPRGVPFGGFASADWERQAPPCIVFIGDETFPGDEPWKTLG